MTGFDDATLRRAVATAESYATYDAELPDASPFPGPQTYVPSYVYTTATAALDSEALAEVAHAQVDPTARAGLLGAGYISVLASVVSVANTDHLFAYQPKTHAQYSLTVRTPQGTGSGWAGVTAYDWQAINVDALTATAVGKCQRSTDPVALEPGKYTLILEPQAVADLLGPMFGLPPFGRALAEEGLGAYAVPGRKGETKIGRQMLDGRLSILQDPLDADIATLAFDGGSYGEALQRVVWFDHGVLAELPYDREYAVKHGLNRGAALLTANAYRVTGGEISIEEMIATTKHGLFVTRFHGVAGLDDTSLMTTGTTRDGLWLIENGKVIKAIKNFRFNESPLFAFNNVLQLGRPVRTFGNLVVPPIKVSDFTFTSLADAI